MANLLNKPMIVHVYERVSENALLTTTVVATCDEEVVKVLGGVCSHHERVPDRCAEALYAIEKADGVQYDIISSFTG